MQGCQRRTYLRLILVIPAPFYCCHCKFTTQTRLAALLGFYQHAAACRTSPACHLLHFLNTSFTLSQCNPALLVISHSACNAGQCRVTAGRYIPIVQHTAQGHTQGSGQFFFLSSHFLMSRQETLTPAYGLKKKKNILYFYPTQNQINKSLIEQ